MALEATVVGSYTSIGPRLRRWRYRWAPASKAGGLTAVVNGATSGLGKAAALALGGLGASVCLVGRDPRELDVVARSVRSNGGQATTAVANLEDLGQIEGLALGIARAHPRVDALINNAGALFRQRTTVDGGLEATTVINLLTPYLLTESLLPALASAGGRVITVTSAGMYTQRFDLSNLVVSEQHYRGTVAYARAKRAQVVLTEEWQRRHGLLGVDFYAVHPGWADTPGLSRSLPGFARVMHPFLRSPSEGVDTAVWLATSTLDPGGEGRMWLDRRPRSPYRLPCTWASPERRREEGDSLWNWCREQCGPFRMVP
jgi:dehydrogenase/reductase SDR family member 12